MSARTPYLFAGSLRDNLLLALRHRPMRPAEYDDATARRRARQIDEARRSGNIDFDLRADWIDYEAAGVEDRDELSRRITEVLRAARFRRGCLHSACAGALTRQGTPT